MTPADDGRESARRYVRRHRREDGPQVAEDEVPSTAQLAAALERVRQRFRLLAAGVMVIAGGMTYGLFQLDGAAADRANANRERIEADARRTAQVSREAKLRTLTSCYLANLERRDQVRFTADAAAVLIRRGGDAEAARAASDVILARGRRTLPARYCPGLRGATPSLLRVARMDAVRIRQAGRAKTGSPAEPTPRMRSPRP